MFLCNVERNKIAQIIGYAEQKLIYWRLVMGGSVNLLTKL